MILTNKKIIAYSCILLACTSLAACSSDTDNTEALPSLSSSSLNISSSSSSSSTQNDSEKKLKQKKLRLNKKKKKLLQKLNRKE